MWNKAEELAYWNAKEDKYYTDNIAKKFMFFDVSSYFKDFVDLAVDIGGGKFGGALMGFRFAERKILVDVLAKEFRLMGKLYSYIDSITANFSDIPLKNECADVVFAWNVYDHANDIKHFEDGIFEALRILKSGGLLFGSFPLRRLPNHNHPVCLTRGKVFDVISIFNTVTLKEFYVHEPHYRDDILFIVVRKV